MRRRVASVRARRTRGRTRTDAGFYLPPADFHWSLYGAPEQLENPDSQECYWELQKFLDLALKANPNVLECLWTPLVEHTTPLADERLRMREAFLSKLVYQTYNGYVLGQFKKLEQDLRARGEVRWKHVMHLVRLLLSGIALLRDGIVVVRVDEHRTRLLAIREGGMSWQEVDAWRLDLHRDLDAAYASTRLPDRPDYEAVNRFLTQGSPHRRAAGRLTMRSVDVTIDARLQGIARAQPFPLPFATVTMTRTWRSTNRRCPGCDARSKTLVRRAPWRRSRR